MNSIWSGLVRQKPVPVVTIKSTTRITNRERLEAFLLEHGPTDSLDLAKATALSVRQVAASLKKSPLVRVVGLRSREHVISRRVAWVSIRDDADIERVKQTPAALRILDVLSVCGEMNTMTLCEYLGASYKTMTNAIYRNPRIFRIAHKKGHGRCVSNFAIYEYAS